jgi:hypothetical protein
MKVSGQRDKKDFALNLFKFIGEQQFAHKKDLETVCADESKLNEALTNLLAENRIAKYKVGASYYYQAVSVRQEHATALETKQVELKLKDDLEAELSECIAEFGDLVDSDARDNMAILTAKVNELQGLYGNLASRWKMAKKTRPKLYSKSTLVKEINQVTENLFILQGYFVANGIERAQFDQMFSLENLDYL